jgi:hypothetical protein
MSTSIEPLVDGVRWRTGHRAVCPSAWRGEHAESGSCTGTAPSPLCRPSRSQTTPRAARRLAARSTVRSASPGEHPISVESLDGPIPGKHPGRCPTVPGSTCSPTPSPCKTRAWRPMVRRWHSTTRPASRADRSYGDAKGAALAHWSADPRPDHRRSLMAIPPHLSSRRAQRRIAPPELCAWRWAYNLLALPPRGPAGHAGVARTGSVALPRVRHAHPPCPTPCPRDLFATTTTRVIDEDCQEPLRV